MIQKIRTYVRDVWQEMGKVTWPSRDELRESTLVVIVATAIVTVFVFIVDRIVDGGITGLLRLFG